MSFQLKSFDCPMPHRRPKDSFVRAYAPTTTSFIHVHDTLHARLMRVCAKEYDHVVLTLSALHDNNSSALCGRAKAGSQAVLCNPSQPHDTVRQGISGTHVFPPIPARTNEVCASWLFNPVSSAHGAHVALSLVPYTRLRHGSRSLKLPLHSRKLLVEFIIRPGTVVLSQLTWCFR